MSDPGLKGFKGVEPRGHFYQGVGVEVYRDVGEV